MGYESMAELDKVRMRFSNFFTVSEGSGCWEWHGAQKKNSYGKFRFEGKTIDAHRMAWFLAFEQEAKGIICHHCDNVICVNPEHLYEGSVQSNQRDAVDRKRHKNSRKTHCIRGHLLSGKNIWIYQGKYKARRQCILCRKIKLMGKKPETLFKERVQKDLRVIPNSWWQKISQRSVRGCPDILGCIQGRFIAIELKKSKDAKIDALQTYNVRSINNTGAIALVSSPESWAEDYALLLSL